MSVAWTEAGGWTEAEEEAGRQACETTKGQGYEVAYEEYKRVVPTCT